MKRALLGFALLAVGFGGGLAVALTTRLGKNRRTIRATTTTSQVVNGNRSADRMPAPIPTGVVGSTDPHTIVLSSAIPVDANLDSVDYVEQKPRQLVVTWEREHLTRDSQAARRTALVGREGLDYRGPGIHCCYRKVRESWLRWNSPRLVTVRRIVRKNRRGWPPG